MSASQRPAERRQVQSEDVREVATKFDIIGELLAISLVSRGHINDTFVSTWRCSDGERRFVHQRINSDVFRDPLLVIGNIERVSNHVTREAPGFCLATFVQARTGQNFHKDAFGDYWRTYIYIENCQVYDICPDAAHAAAVGEIFGRFLSITSNLPPEELTVSLPGFQDVPGRVRALEQAAAADKFGRLRVVERESEKLLTLTPHARIIDEALNNKVAVVRVTHGDPKVNNVLFDAGTPRVRALIDLDTCMPGTALYEFGDMVRSAGVTCTEDEADLSLVTANWSLVEALTLGFLRGVGPVLARPELMLLARAPQVIAFTLACRFLTDYLLGDVYFKTHYPEQNLRRTRTQMAILAEYQRLERPLAELIRSAADKSA